MLGSQNGSYDSIDNMASSQTHSTNSMRDLSSAFLYRFDLNATATNILASETDCAIVHESKNKSDTYLATHEAENSLKEFINEILTLNLSHKATDAVLTLSKNMIQSVNKLNTRLLQDNNGMTLSNVMESTTALVFDEVAKYETQYKRNKEFEFNEFYVPPKNFLIGLRWEPKTIKNRKGMNVKIPRMVQNTFQYISIVDTIKSLCKRKEFIDCYLHENTVRNHECKPDVYKHFCCGSTYKNCWFFKENPLALQIHLSSDEFEICNPLSSKSNIHKICAIYFTIQNMPTEYLSKLDNIYIVAIANADDLKSKTTDFNNLWQPITNDLKFLETVGIVISEQIKIKGTLTHLSFDNLGANQALGFVSCFVASHFCRFCVASKSECQLLSKEDAKKIRTKELYNKQLEIINASEKVKYEETKGLKFYCKLSNLNFFHISDNPTVDAMHDLAEGAVPFLFKKLFGYGYHHKIFSEEELGLLIQFHDYGWLNRHKVPSIVLLDKRSIGQNASQSLCLLKNLPFILYKFRNHPKLIAVWECVSSLLRVVELVGSYEITSDQLNVLEREIETHLEGVKLNFDSTLKPKHHFLTHYPSIIRMIGPVRHIDMMRVDAKHQALKKIATTTKNFMNINKTLAVVHQQNLCLSGFTYKNKIEFGATKSISNEFRLKYSEVLEIFDIDQLTVSETKYLRFNNYEYRHGLLIIKNSVVYKIHNILVLNSDYMLLVKSMTLAIFNNFLNCFEIKENSSANYELISVHNLINKKSYEMSCVENSTYILSATVDLNKVDSWK